ncbi:PAB-dependent poly(A)-specific ribonuclease subunit 3 [Balamuthia mandrillaris]
MLSDSGSGVVRQGRQRLEAALKDGTARVIKGEGLTAADVGGTSDPYALVGLYKEQLWADRHKPLKDLSKKTAVKTKIIKKTLDPVWDQVLEIPITQKSLNNKCGIRVQIWDWDRASGDDFLGETAFLWSEHARQLRGSAPHQELQPRNAVKKKDDLKVQGSVQLAFAWRPDEH